MVTQEIQVFLGTNYISLGKDVIKVDIYNSSRQLLTDNCNASIQFSDSNNILVLESQNFIQTDFPLKVVALDSTDTSGSVTLFDLYRTSNIPTTFNVAVGKKNELCKNIRIADLYKYIAENLDYLSSNPYNWNLNDAVAQDKLNVYSKEEISNITRQYVYASFDKHQGQVTGIDLSEYYSCNGIVDISGYRTEEMVQYYKIKLKNFYWRGLGRGEFLKVMSLEGQEFSFLQKPIDVPVFISPFCTQEIDSSSSTGMAPPMMIVTPYNRNYNMGSNQLDANSLYLVVFDYYFGYGIPEIQGTYEYLGSTGAIGNIQ